MKLGEAVLTITIILFFSQLVSSQDNIIIDKIHIEGNGVTKTHIIERELLFQIGDTLTQNELTYLFEKSRENLLNTSLFNFASIDYVNDSMHFATVNIDLQERWYIWPYPVLEHADRNLSSYINNEEWSRIDYGLFVLINNFRGRKEILKLKAIFGHNNKYVLSYFNPFVNKEQKLGFGLKFDYTNNKEVAFQIANNELNYLKLTDDFARKTINALSYLTYRPQIYFEGSIGLWYENVHIADTILTLNSDYFYNKKDKIELLTFYFIVDYDKRDSKYYPLKGFRLNSTIVKKGIGIFNTEGPFFIESILEGNSQLFNKIYFNTSIGSKLSFNRYNSFYFSGAIGYRNYLRGMEYYVSNGTNYYISKSNLKFEIIPQTKINIGFLPTDKFSKAHYALYCNLFFDTGYVDSKQNIQTDLSNEFLFSGGIGLDFVTYYDKVLRIEYSLNKFGEQGIFFHLVAPIIR